MMKNKMYTRSKLGSNNGFTLVEALIAVVLFAMLFGATLMIYLAGTESWTANSTRLEIQQELRKAITRIAEDLRQAGNSSIVNVTPGGAAQTSIVFRKVTGVSNGVATWSANTTTYSVSSGQLLKQVGLGTPTIAAIDMASASFERETATPDLVNVTLSATKLSLKGRTMTMTATFSVKLRNG